MAGEARFRLDVRLVVVLVRMSVYAICLTLVLLSGKIENHGLLVVGLLVVAVLSSIPSNSEQVTQWRPVLEGVATVILTSGTGTVQQALLPYLIAPALDAGLLGGLRVVIYEAGFASATLLACGFLQSPENVRAYTSFSAQWVVLSLAVGLLASWVRRIRVQQAVTSSSSYAAAYRLLSQLRLVSRQLSGGLDSVALCPGDAPGHPRPGCAIRARRCSSAPRAAGSCRWRPQASTGSTGPRRSTTTHPGRTRGQRAPRNGSARLSRQGTAASRPCSRCGSACARSAWSAWSGPRRRSTEDALAEAEALLDEGALRLETALLFDEVRTIATAEERRRLAREIHDGIAQELASLGYVVDDLASAPRDEQHAASSCRSCAAS